MLEGEVDEVAEKKTALRAAGAVAGVTAIIDRLHLHRAEPCSDADLVRLARRSITEDPALVCCFVPSTAPEDHSKEEVLCPEGWEGCIEIRAEDAVLTLDGEVPGLVHKRIAGVLAWRTPGCRDVVNALEVDPPERDSDGKIEEAVNLVLGRTDPARAASVRVTVEGGVVSLAGRVSPDQARAIERDVWAIFGVDQVISSLRPNPTLGGTANCSLAQSPSPRRTEQR
jgi:osmotically-inducible protein OsmY